MHAPPSSLSHWFWRFLLIGHDYYWQNTLLAQANTGKRDYRDAIGGMKDKLGIFCDRVGKMLAYEPRHLIYLPFAVPVALSTAALVAVGYWITCLKPSYLLKTYNQVLGEV
jgi:hypothetical protein